jgi:hypothetical protein
MTFKQRNAKICAQSLTVTAIVASGLLAGCTARSNLPYHVIHNPVDDRPQDIFVDPVGKGFPALVQRTYKAYEPLPLVRRPFYDGPSSSKVTPEVPPPPAIKNPAALEAPALNGPLALPKRTTLKAVRDRTVRAEPAPTLSDATQTSLTAPLPPTAILSAPLPEASAPLAKADAIAAPDVAEARSSTQLRR